MLDFLGLETKTSLIIIEKILCTEKRNEILTDLHGVVWRGLNAVKERKAKGKINSNEQFPKCHWPCGQRVRGSRAKAVTAGANAVLTRRSWQQGNEASRARLRRGSRHQRKIKPRLRSTPAAGMAVVAVGVCPTWRGAEAANAVPCGAGRGSSRRQAGRAEADQKQRQRWSCWLIKQVFR